MARRINNVLTVQKKVLAAPHIEVTFTRTQGGDIILRFITGPDAAFAQELRMGERLTMTLERADEGN